MHQAMVNIILDRIHDQFINEENFCKVILDMPVDVWNEFKKGNLQLPSEKMQKIRTLFSDYEWMLLQKIVSQSVMFPEKRNYAVSEYKRLKSVIAKEWVKSGLASVELISHQRPTDKELRAIPQKHVVNLRVIANYGEWGYDDILEFFMPGVIQQQIGDTQVDLLEWVDENLTRTYTEKSQEII